MRRMSAGARGLIAASLTLAVITVGVMVSSDGPKPDAALANGPESNKPNSDTTVAAEPGPLVPDFGEGWGARSPEAAMALAESTGRVVESVSERTADTTMYALPSGAWALAQSFATEFVEVIDPTTGDAAWQPVNPELTATTDRLEPRLVAGSGSYATGGDGDSVLASFTGIDSDVTVELWWDGMLPHGRVDGARVTYERVARDVDLVVESRVSGFEVFLIARSEDALRLASAIPLTYRVENGSFQLRDGGKIAVLDFAGKDVAYLPAPRAWDAAQDALMSAPVLEPVAAVPSGEEFALPTLELTLEPDTRISTNEVTFFLELPPGQATLGQLTYPVVLDPIYEILSPNTVVSFDTMVQNGVTRDMSGDPELNVGTWNGGTDVVRPFLEFSISPITTRDLISAKLYLWNYHSWSCTARSWTVYTSGGVSTATRWTNQPSAYSSPSTTSSDTFGYSSSCNDNWAVADVTDHVKLWKAAGQTSGTMTLRTAETDNFSWKRFNSGNAGANQPKVVYEVNRAPSAPTGIATTVGGVASTIAPGAVLNDSDIVATAPISGKDGDGDTLALAVTVKRNGLVLVEQSPGTAVSSGNATFDLQPYLAYGGTYEVTFYFWDGRLMSPAASPPLTFSIESPQPSLDYGTGSDEWSQVSARRGTRYEY
jgi:hypothetical protein